MHVFIRTIGYLRPDLIDQAGYQPAVSSTADAD